MSKGTMSTDGNYPSSSGQPLDGTTILKGVQMRRHKVAMNIGGVPGTGASYKGQTLIVDDEISQWVDVANASLSGDGAAATGQLVFDCIGAAVRIVAANGTSPGTGNNTPAYSLHAFPIEPEHYSVPRF